MKSFVKMAGCLVAVLTGLAACAGGEKVVLAEGGVAKARIVIAKRATRAAQFAAQELKWHLDRMTGAEWEIVSEEGVNGRDARSTRVSGAVILVGESERTASKSADFGSQQYKVEVRPGAVELIGFDKPDFAKVVYENGTNGVSGSGWPDFYDAQGTLYAVYDFLERDLGVRWTDSTDYGTYVPKKGDLALSVGCRRGEPFILSRTKSGKPNGYSPLLWNERSAEAKAYDAIAYRRGGPKKSAAQKRLFLLRHRFGGERRFANHSFNAWPARFLKDGVHNADGKRAKEFEQYRPDYFAKGYPGYPQLCYSNPDTIAQVVKDIRAYFDGPVEKRRWGADNYCLEPNDNGSYCKCERCTPQYEPERAKENGSDSTYWFTFVNTVAREIAKSHPGMKISTLCYHDHEALPTGIRLEPNVIVWFCLSSNRRPYSQNYEKQLGRMREWRAAYPGQPLAMWLYNTFPLETANHGNFRCFPGAFAHEAERQYRLFKELDARHGIFHCGFNGEVDNYLQLEWMIDPTRPADEMLDEYFASYGAAGKHLKDFYLLCERRFCDRSLYQPADWRQSAALAWGKLGDAPTMERLGEMMAAAERAASTPEEKARVQLWKLGIWDYMKPAADRFRIRSALPTPAFVARRIPSAGGKWANVATDAFAPVKCPLYGANTQVVSKDTPATLRAAHDGEYLYLELAMDCVTSNLLNSSNIMSHDCWELVMARQQGQPYRHFFSAPDGRMKAASFGEVNWRANVPAAESGHESFRATCETANTPTRWTTRYVFPLAEACSGGIAPGEKLYFNGVAVLSRTIVPDPAIAGRYAILSYCSMTSVHTTDRTCVIELEK